MNLAEVRKAKGLTQKEVAARADIARESYTNIENGARRPSVQLAKRLGSVLDINWTVFFEDEPDKEDSR